MDGIHAGASMQSRCHKVGTLFFILRSLIARSGVGVARTDLRAPQQLDSDDVRRKFFNGPQTAGPPSGFQR